MEMVASLAVITCLCFSSLLVYLSHTSPPRLPIGAHPSDEKYYEAEEIECKDGSKSFTKDRLNDDFCDCADGADEPGTSAYPSGTFYCRNMGSTPKFLFSSRVNDNICDCCDGSDEYDGTVMCPNTCVMGGNIIYQRTNHVPIAMKHSVNTRKTKAAIEMEEDSLQKLIGLKILVFLQVVLVVGFAAFWLSLRRKTRKRNSR